MTGVLDARSCEVYCEDLHRVKMAMNGAQTNFCERYSAAKCERMDISALLLSTLLTLISLLLAWIMHSSLRSVACRLLASKIGLALVCALVYCVFKLSESATDFCLPGYNSELCRTNSGLKYFVFSIISSMILASIVGNAMGVFLANFLQNCMRMDIYRTLGFSAVGFVMVSSLASILHNYVMRMSVSRIFGIAMGWMLVEILQKLFERLQQRYKKQQANPVSLQIQASTLPFLHVQAIYLRSLNLQARLQAYNHGQHVDAHQDPELHELCLELDELCHTLHKEWHMELHKMSHELHALCQTHELCNCTNTCTNLCCRLGSRLNEDEVPNASEVNRDALPGFQEEAAGK